MVMRPLCSTGLVLAGEPSRLLHGVKDRIHRARTDLVAGTPEFLLSLDPGDGLDGNEDPVDPTLEHTLPLHHGLRIQIVSRSRISCGPIEAGPSSEPTALRTSPALPAPSAQP
jgi:hypothetical protein